MLFKIGNTVYSPEDIECAIIMASDSEKQQLIDVLTNMPPADHERWFRIVPQNSKTDPLTWMSLSDAEKEKLIDYSISVPPLKHYD